MSRAAQSPLTVTEALLGRMVAENHILREQTEAHAAEIVAIRTELDALKQRPQCGVAEMGGEVET